MAQYEVPQFIDRKTRILGPLTIRQFVAFFGVAMILFFLYFYLNFIALIFVGSVLVAAAVVVSFVNVNGRPLSEFIFSVFGFFLNPRTYTKQYTAIKAPHSETETRRQIHALAEILDRPQQ
ncbi:MAG: PrgI family protein [Candidatus Spechtbacterales bacterium]